MSSFVDFEYIQIIVLLEVIEFQYDLYHFNQIFGDFALNKVKTI